MKRNLNFVSRESNAICINQLSSTVPDFVALLRPLSESLSRLGGFVILNVLHEAGEHLQPIGVPLELLVVERLYLVLSKRRDCYSESSIKV